MGSEVMPRRLASSLLETFDRLEAAIGLDDRQENPVHALVVFRTIGQRDAVNIEGADLADLIEEAVTRYGVSQRLEDLYVSRPTR